ncbi:MAG TPA: glutamate--tRNA ligase family protein [Chitinophaga sp.]|nr:glutamate--tRNA ligase family protein [Chitinophaga sp.]
MKTRIAPTPSGYLHLGNVLSFSVTAGLAKRAGIKIVLRIDDLDRDRVRTEYVKDIFDTLNFLEIPWDEGPRNYQEYKQEFSQVHRLELYNAVLEQLREDEQLFACDCSRAQVNIASSDGVYPGTCECRSLSLDQKEVSWRLHTAETRKLVVKTMEGPVTSGLPDLMRSFVVKKKDGFPAYQLASLVDDQHFGVDVIVRGKDLWDSTLAQMYLGALLPGNTFYDNLFHHHVLLTDETNGKLSKSDGATSVQSLRKAGKTPSEVFGMIGRMLGIAEPVCNYRELALAVERMGRDD